MNLINRKHCLLTSTALLFSSLCPPLLFAVPAIDEVVVYAQRTGQARVDVPIALSLMGGEEFEAARLDSVEGFIPMMPGISGWEQGVSTPIIAIRGISSNTFGIGGESSVGVFVDDAYIGRINSIGATLFDVESVEVLRGPQNTLYGRNASAGIISIRTRLPEKNNSLRLRFGAGEFDGGADTHDWTVTGNTVLTEKLYLRASLNRALRHGYDENILADDELGGEDTWAGRVALRWLPTDDLEAILRLSAQNTNTGGLGYKTLDPALAAAGGVTTDPYDGEMASDQHIFDNNRSRDASLTLIWQLENGAEIKSVTAWHKNESPNFFDVDGSAVNIFNASFDMRESETWYQDIQLTGEGENTNWLLGASYFEEDVDTDIVTSFSSIPNRAEYKSYAVYGDLTWHFFSDWFTTFGVRFSRDEKEFAIPPGLETEEDWDNVHPRLVVGYQLQDNGMLYASVSKGFKAGGFNSSIAPFERERVLSYELGYKAQWDTVSLNTAAYYYDYEDYQVQVFVGGVIQTINAPEVDGRGLEVELLWQPNEAWRFSAFAGLSKSEFDDFIADGADLSGNSTILSPEEMAGLTATHTLFLDSAALDIRGEWQYQSEQFFTAENTDLSRQGGYSLFNLFVDYRPDNASWHVALVGRNVGNKEHLLFQQEVGAGLPVSQRAAPRYLGLEWGWEL